MYEYIKWIKNKQLLVRQLKYNTTLIIFPQRLYIKF